MQIKTEIDESRIIKLVEDELALRIIEDNRSDFVAREAGRGLKSAVDKAVQAYIYKNKDLIINRVVERATKEIVKKGLPKLLENLGKEIER
ncbi:hypothetical protein Q5O14_17835 [Eubacteriaceae bacterium ES2]|nr:hypothetical protein Q5O14_17835 [Eubacteriaceae bacterium ES2]